MFLTYQASEHLGRIGCSERSKLSERKAAAEVKQEMEEEVGEQGE